MTGKRPTIGVHIKRLDGPKQSIQLDIRLPDGGWISGTFAPHDFMLALTGRPIETEDIEAIPPIEEGTDERTA